MSDLLQNVETLQKGLLSQATGGGMEEHDFERVRRLILNDPSLHSVTPEFLRTCRSPIQFWHFIQPKFPSYAERRRYIWEEFAPLLERVERAETPSYAFVTEALGQFDAANIPRIWAKAMERREADPEGAITVARTLLEAVCKHILDEMELPYGSNPDLPDLYKSVAKTLNLSPSQHTEQVFKQILGGCTAVVEGLGALRNRLGDAHGQGKLPVRPAARHAELAVNLAGAVATFLVSTFDQTPALAKRMTADES
jgi:hypothetical protein